jgi:hypothetical protein
VAVRQNPFELPDDRNDPDGVVPDGPASEAQPGTGMMPVCPNCGGRVHVVTGLGHVARWVCMGEGGVVVPRWTTDPTGSPSHFFNLVPPAEPPPRARGLRQSDIQGAVRAPKPAPSRVSEYLDAPPQPRTRPS